MHPNMFAVIAPAVFSLVHTHCSLLHLITSCTSYPQLSSLWSQCGSTSWLLPCLSDCLLVWPSSVCIPDVCPLDVICALDTIRVHFHSAWTPRRKLPLTHTWGGGGLQQVDFCKILFFFLAFNCRCAEWGLDNNMEKHMMSPVVQSVVCCRYKWKQ